MIEVPAFGPNIFWKRLMRIQKQRWWLRTGGAVFLSVLSLACSSGGTGPSATGGAAGSAHTNGSGGQGNTAGTSQGRGGTGGEGTGGSAGTTGSGGNAGDGGLCSGVVCKANEFCCGPPACGSCANVLQGPNCPTSCGGG